MKRSEHIKSELKASSLQDLAIVVLVTGVCSLLAIRFEWTERFFSWTRAWESLELDEIAFVLLSLALGLAWFSARRWRDARRELDRRLEPGDTAAAAPPVPDAADLLEKSQQLIKLIKVTALAVHDNASTDGFPPPGRNAHYARSILEAADQLEESLTPLLRGCSSQDRPAAPATAPTTVG
jgi:hypothetical protein